MWYKFLKDEFKLTTTREKELDWLYENVNKANIARVFLCEKVVLVLRMPERIRRNSRFLHDISNPAIEYSNYKSYYIYGVKINKQLLSNDEINKLKSDNRKLFKVNSLQVEANFPSFSDRKTFEKIINGYNSQDFKWFPQIYIPYFELHKNNLNEIPIIALVLNDEETIPGYTLDNEGNLIVLSINHEFAKQHLVWIISVNERTNNKGEVIRNKNQRINDSQRLEMRSYGTSFWLWTIVLHSPHESWGDSELSVVCRHGNTNCTPNGSLYQILDFKSTHLMEIVHSFGQNDTYLTTTNSFSFPEGLIDYGECYDFIFFEEDPHRNSTEIISSYNSCTPIDNSNRMTIFSYSGPYMHKFHCPPVNNYPLQQQVAAQTYIEPNEADVTVGAIRRN